MPVSLIALGSPAEALSFHADRLASNVTAAKLLAPYDADSSAQHLEIARTAHREIGRLLAAASSAPAQPTPSTPIIFFDGEDRSSEAAL